MTPQDDAKKENNNQSQYPKTYKNRKTLLGTVLSDNYCPLEEKSLRNYNMGYVLTLNQAFDGNIYDR